MVFLRSLFTWKYSGVLIPFFVGMGYAAMTNHQIVMAYVLSVLGGIWAMGYYFYSDRRKGRVNNVVKLRAAASKHQTAEKVISKYNRAVIRHYCIEIGTYAVVALITGGFMYWLYLGNEEYELSLLKGRIYPANDPMPSHNCGEIKDAEIAVFLGSNVAITHTFPHTVLKVNGEKRLVVNKANDGSIAITLDVFSEDGRVIATINDGQFIVNYNNSLDMRRSDRSSLKVIDQFNRQVLNVRYLNQQAILLDAVLYYPGTKTPIVIDGSRSILSSVGSMSSNCSRDVGGADISLRF